eukprot:TRINITY_DN15731_c0_g1_i3.p1 TRINITY_DN15731_c0_g1~~TRINITY_DN15731_c0_g1_i3.p1  ORF type:complete len:420 (+),score=138.64 TRINITY_DN15731_c0_g1_i3:180-1439(+)
MSAEGGEVVLGSVVGHFLEPKKVLGSVQSIREDGSVEVALKDQDVLTIYEADSLVPLNRYFVASGWSDSEDGACLIRSSTKKDAEHLGKKHDGDVVEITRELEGHMMIADGGWVKRAGHTTGMWVEVDQVTGRRLSQPSVTTPRPAETDSTLQALKESFLRGASIDEALRLAVANTTPKAEARLPHRLSHRPAEMGSDGEASLQTTQDSQSITQLNSTIPQNSAMAQAVKDAAAKASPPFPVSKTPSAELSPEEVLLFNTKAAPPGPETSEPVVEAAETIVTPRKSHVVSGEKSLPLPPASVEHTPETGAISPARAWTAAASKKGGAGLTRRSQPLTSPLELDPTLQAWLKAKKLSPYSSTFQAHEVDMEVLPLLTYADLLEMRLPSHVCKAVKIYAPDRNRGGVPAGKVPSKPHRGKR